MPRLPAHAFPAAVAQHEEATIKEREAHALVAAWSRKLEAYNHRIIDLENHNRELSALVVQMLETAKRRMAGHLTPMPRHSAPMALTQASQ